jgi:acyl-CoA dehydrogenase
LTNTARRSEKLVHELYLDWPFFSDFHRTFAREFREWTAAEMPPYEESEGGDAKTARAIFGLLGKGGWLEYTLPKSGKLDLRTICLMREILGYSSAMADVALSDPVVSIMPLALYGPDGLQDEVLHAYSRGEMMPAFALSEPGAGSDAASIETKATPDGDHYTINGRKTWTSNCGEADVYTVMVRMGSGSGSKGVTAFLVDGDAPGIELEERIEVLSPHTVGTLKFNDVRVPAERMVGAAGDGFGIAMTALELFRPTVGAAALGMARRAADEALLRSTQRVTFNKPISEHQLIQEKLAGMAVKIEAAALLIYRAAWQHDVSDGPISRESAMAKLYATEAAQEVVDQAQQIFGGLGVARGSVVERLYRHVRGYRIFDGTSEIQKLIIARDLLKSQ